MAEPAKRAATYEDLLAVPEHLIAEILFGELVTHPRPTPQHSGAASVIGALLIPPFQLGRSGPGGWIFLVEPELHLGGHVAVPDLAGWKRERLPKPEEAWIDIAPDWVCEVLSPSTEGYDRSEKRAIYAEAGVGHLWLVDPRPQTLEAFELREGKWLLLNAFRGNAEVAAAPFPEPSFPLGLLWPFDPPSAVQA
jgi:Uma2 family endonuclease